MSHIQWAKDQLKQFDEDMKDIREEIDRLYAMLAKKQEARLQFHAMVEREFGAAPQTVVMQDMSMRAGIGYLDRIEEAQQLPRPASGGGGYNRLDDPTLPPVGSIERKRELDRRNYHKRQARLQQLDGSTGERMRSDAGKPKGKRPQRNTPENREASETIRARIRDNVEHRTEPFSSGDLVRDFGITDARDKQRVYQAVNCLARLGELKPIGVSATGYTYLRQGVANDHPQDPGA